MNPDWDSPGCPLSKKHLEKIQAKNLFKLNFPVATFEIFSFFQSLPLKQYVSPSPTLFSSIATHSREYLI